MKHRLFKMVGGLLALCLMATLFQNTGMAVRGANIVEHQIAAGESREGNPLKGFVPFDYGTTTFPHSMEWFYLPVSDVQTGMNTYDWSALENRLNAIAKRGHQAVMRFYYDYPGEPSGVPQFLIDQGLQMKYYNEPESLGGAGYCPDYENTLFRQSMQNFIKAFGEKYDGDPRLGFITLGLLGFWGEWHNWPYDEDTSDGKPDWSISTEVYREVLEAFDGAFDITQLCVREPKSGINFKNYDVGFHDDSYGYATLTMASGGQDWSYMQKMKDSGLMDAWKTNCIGGEIYPPNQTSMFVKETQSGECQDWNRCLEETHATWLLCDQMRYYSGTTLLNARKAADQLGYDFQVEKAYYRDVVQQGELYLKLAIKNIGAAPFYYDHKMWPVKIGVKQGKNLVKTWETDWDLCNVPADGNITEWEYSVNHHELQAGEYTLCIKVENPLTEGNNFWFANENQEEDGWLTLGTFEVEQQSDTQNHVTSDNIEIDGFQISTNIGGIRTVYSFDTQVEGQPVIERGLIYGLQENGCTEQDLVITNTSDAVYCSKATDNQGKLQTSTGKDVSYVMTMKYVGQMPVEFAANYYVRAYAKLADGRYAYSKISRFRIYDVADYLYQNRLMADVGRHQYLYDNILSRTVENYGKIDYVK